MTRPAYVIRPGCARCGELLASIIPVRTGALVECVRCGLVATYDERHDFTHPGDREPSGWNYQAIPCGGRLGGRPCPALVTPTSYRCPLHYGAAVVEDIRPGTPEWDASERALERQRARGL